VFSNLARRYNFRYDDSQLRENGNLTKTLRSQATRDRILAAARRLFGKLGYEHTTIRAIASTAKSNPGLVIRYFDSKEALFTVAMRFDLRLPDFKAVPREVAGQALVAHFLERWEGTDAGSELPALLRLAISHDGAKVRLLELFERQVAPTLVGLMPTRGAQQRAALIATQLVGLALTRYVLRLQPVTSLDPDLIIRRIGAVVQSHLDESG
jgi:AcrR family transcriptional regulator